MSDEEENNGYKAHEDLKFAAIGGMYCRSDSSACLREVPLEAWPSVAHSLSPRPLRRGNCRESGQKLALDGSSSRAGGKEGRKEMVA